MSGFALLWSKILRSSIWINESKETKLLWIACIALRDSNGEIQCSLVGLADAAKLTVEECRESLKVLLSPDKDDSSGMDDGRRLREIPGGWLVVNHDMYRFSTEEKREFWRKQQAERRAKLNKKVVRKMPKTKGGTLPGEDTAIRALEAGREDIFDSNADSQESLAVRREKAGLG
jgi:hypothetical protein